MAKSSKYNEYRKKINLEEKEQVKPKTIIKPKASVKVKLMLIGTTSKYVYADKSGNRIIWSGAGSVKTVSREDADILLTKMRVGSCCGGSPQRKPMFKEI